MAVGMIASLLSGAAYGTESGNMIEGARVGTDGHFFAAIDIAAFEDPDRFRERVDGVIAQVHGSRRAPGTDRLLVPGELEAEFEAAYARDGILLAGTTVDEIAEQAAKLGVDAGPLFGPG